MAKTLKRQRKEHVRQMLIDQGLEVIYHHKPNYEMDSLLQICLNRLAKHEGVNIQQIYRRVDQRLREIVARAHVDESSRNK